MFEKNTLALALSKFNLIFTHVVGNSQEIKKIIMFDKYFRDE